jgi:hypothetical protein
MPSPMRINTKIITDSRNVRDIAFTPYADFPFLSYYFCRYFSTLPYANAFLERYATV